MALYSQKIKSPSYPPRSSIDGTFMIRPPSRLVLAPPRRATRTISLCLLQRLPPLLVLPFFKILVPPISVRLFNPLLRSPLLNLLPLPANQSLHIRAFMRLTPRIPPQHLPTNIPRRRTRYRRRTRILMFTTRRRLWKSYLRIIDVMHRSYRVAETSNRGWIARNNGNGG